MKFIHDTESKQYVAEPGDKVKYIISPAIVGGSYFASYRVGKARITIAEDTDINKLKVACRSHYKRIRPRKAAK